MPERLQKGRVVRAVRRRVCRVVVVHVARAPRLYTPAEGRRHLALAKSLRAELSKSQRGVCHLYWNGEGRAGFCRDVRRWVGQRNVRYAPPLPVAHAGHNGSLASALPLRCHLLVAQHMDASLVHMIRDAHPTLRVRPLLLVREPTAASSPSTRTRSTASGGSRASRRRRRAGPSRPRRASRSCAAGRRSSAPSWRASSVATAGPRARRAGTTTAAGSPTNCAAARLRSSTSGWACSRCCRNPCSCCATSWAGGGFQDRPRQLALRRRARRRASDGGAAGGGRRAPRRRHQAVHAAERAIRAAVPRRVRRVGGGGERRQR